MNDDGSVIYGLEHQARSLASQITESESINFVVGTQSIRTQNQVHLIEFDDDNNFINKKVFSHPEGEIWSIASSPVDENIISTVYNASTPTKMYKCAAIHRMPVASDNARDDNGRESLTSAVGLQKLCELPVDNYGDVKEVLWHPNEQSNSIITVTEKSILLMDVNQSEAVVTQELNVSNKFRFHSACWNPHHNASQLATTTDGNVHARDIRTSGSITFTIENAHGQMVRALDFNPNRQYYLATCGDDCKTAFWDTRNVKTPVLTLNDHSHWVWNVAYNHFHDQLVLTSSSDNRVILNNTDTISSTTFDRQIDDEFKDEKDVLEDGVLRVYEEHEDSVYRVVWSHTDPWVFASLSYDGRIVINRVPKHTKYSILL